jgi:hypothetical protein
LHGLTQRTINRISQNILSPAKKPTCKDTHAAAVLHYCTFWLPDLSGPSPAVFTLQAWHHQTSSYDLRLKSEPEVALRLQGTLKWGLAKVSRAIGKEGYATADRRRLQWWKKSVWIGGE